MNDPLYEPPANWRHLLIGGAVILLIMWVW